VIVVDGSHGEGGGQLLRMAAALSALRGVPVTVTEIRAGRPNPGLAAQHVTALQAVAALCGANVEGLEIGSKEIVFRPGTAVAGRHAFDVGTAGSVTLVLQAALPVAFAAPGTVTLRITGGTDVRGSPPLDSLSLVVLPLLRRLGGRAELILHRRGYYPRGGGSIEVVVHPASGWRPLEVEDPGPVRSIRGVAHVSNLPEDIPKRIKHAALRRLHGHGEPKVEERVYEGEDAVGQGGAIVLWAETERSILGADALAERGKSSERVGEEAAAALAADLDAGATLDLHAADQLLVYLASAPGPSVFTVRGVSGHLRTMAWLLPQFLDREITIHPRGKVSVVRVAGPKA